MGEEEGDSGEGKRGEGVMEGKGSKEKDVEGIVAGREEGGEG